METRGNEEYFVVSEKWKNLISYIGSLFFFKNIYLNLEKL